MNELLQKHGCSNVFTVPEGLRELMADISREVLREQPPKIFEFITNYLSALLITREHGVLAVKLLDDLCDCRPSVSEHLIMLGIHRPEAETLSELIKEEIEAYEPAVGKEKVKEAEIVKKVLKISTFDEELTQKVCQVARNAYRDYWYRKKMLEKSLKVEPDEPWEIAAQHTLELYKKTKPSFGELTRASQRIQSAYRGYHVRRQMLAHLKPKSRNRPKEKLPGPPLDIAESREIDLGPVLDLKVREDNVCFMFDSHAGEHLGLKYDPMKTITHVDPNKPDLEVMSIATFERNERMSRETYYADDETNPYTSTAADQQAKISFAQTTHEVYLDDHDQHHLEKMYAGDVPEDIPDYRSTGSAAPSVVSSGPGTANTTDAEEEEE